MVSSDRGGIGKSVGQRETSYGRCTRFIASSSGGQNEIRQFSWQTDLIPGVDKTTWIFCNWFSTPHVIGGLACFNWRETADAARSTTNECISSVQNLARVRAFVCSQARAMPPTIRPQAAMSGADFQHALGSVGGATSSISTRDETAGGDERARKVGSQESSPLHRTRGEGGVLGTGSRESGPQPPPHEERGGCADDEAGNCGTVGIHSQNDYRSCPWRVAQIHHQLSAEPAAGVDETMMEGAACTKGCQGEEGRRSVGAYSAATYSSGMPETKSMTKNVER